MYQDQDSDEHSTHTQVHKLGSIGVCGLRLLSIFMYVCMYGVRREGHRKQPYMHIYAHT